MSLKDLFADTKKNSAKPVIKKSIEDLNKDGGDSSLNIEEFNSFLKELKKFTLNIKESLSTFAKKS